MLRSSTSLALQLIELTPTTLRKDGHSDGTACTEPARGGKAKSLHQAVNGRTLLLLLLLLLVAAAAAAVFGPVHPKLKKISEKLHGFCKKKKMSTPPTSSYIMHWLFQGIFWFSVFFPNAAMFKLPSGVTRHLACKTKSNLDLYMSNFRERSQESHQTGKPENSSTQKVLAGKGIYEFPRRYTFRWFQG